MVAIGLMAFALGILCGIRLQESKWFSGEKKQGTPTRSIMDWFTPEPTAPTVDVPTMRNTIPRVRPSWRKQRRDLQAANNSKQKERDALFQEK